MAMDRPDGMEVGVMQFNPNSWAERRKRIQEPLSLVEMALFYKAQQHYVELLEEMLREVAQAPVHVDVYALDELSCVFCEPYQDEQGGAHHASTCVVARAKELLEGESV